MKKDTTPGENYRLDQGCDLCIVVLREETLRDHHQIVQRRPDPA